LVLPLRAAGGLRRRGTPLRSDEAIKAQHGVATSPQIIFMGQLIGGHDDCE
jgi:hypothetical protein